MSPNKDKLLCEKYPELYSDRNSRTSCMKYGFPGDGWYKIIDKLSARLVDLIKKLPKEEQNNYRASQVKEKFGTLCFYMTQSTKEMEDAIYDAENESSITCETCGNPGKLTTEGWRRVLCKSCNEKRNQNVK